ncbi:MAG: phosphate signaling complex protein PhoU [Chitinispirillaceae bacterium]|nr:phosphate signaling complex protein PhoU [Chitinispirillaceae bacterium]
MPQHMQRELDTLQKKLLSLSSLVEEQVITAVTSVEKRDITSAQRVISFDHNIDMLEIEVEEDCLKLLALHQPVAIDLRFIIAVMKINNDLERIADLAANIADRVVILPKGESFNFNVNLMTMCEKVVLMLRQCLDSLFKMDVSIAHKVCKSDDDIDNINREIVRYVKEEIIRTPKQVNGYLLLLSVARNLERIADHATNIAEDVIYMINGDIVRHRENKT